MRTKIKIHFVSYTKYIQLGERAHTFIECVEMALDRRIVYYMRAIRRRIHSKLNRSPRIYRTENEEERQRKNKRKTISTNAKRTHTANNNNNNHKNSNSNNDDDSDSNKQQQQKKIPYI